MKLFNDILKIGVVLLIVFITTACVNSPKDFKAQIKETKKVIQSLEKHRQKDLTPLKGKYFEEYQDYYQHLAQILPEIGIKNHEQLLRNCDERLEVCNELERTAILRNSLDWLDNKLEEVSKKLFTLYQYAWKLEKKDELSQVASAEDFEEISKLIDDSKKMLDDTIPAPERQDIAGLEEQIFNELIQS